MCLEGCAASDGVEEKEHGRQFDRQECGAIVCSGAIRGLDCLHIGAVGQGEENDACRKCTSEGLRQHSTIR